MSSREAGNNLSSLSERILPGPEYDPTSQNSIGGWVWRHTDNSVRREFHRHAELEINLVTQGRAVYLVGNRRYALRANMLLWLFPEHNHLLIGESADYRMWILVFDPTLVRQAATGPALELNEQNPQGDYCRRLREDDANWLAQFFDKLTLHTDEPALYNSGLSYALLSAWAAYRASEESGPIGTDIHPAVETAARIIRDEPDDYGLEKIALRAGLSVPRLSLLFRQQLGLTVTDFRNRQRVTRFLRLYGHGQSRTILEAALEAGFGSYPQFHRVFKQVMGCSPADYRRRRS